MNDVYEKLLSLAKRRGFIYPSYEIYGGMAGFYDYGPLGARLKHNIEEKWREFYLKEGFAEISTPIIIPYEVMKASGHVKEFTDIVGKCKKCGVFKIGELDKGRCPICGGETEKFSTNLMFETEIGGRKAFLRPETAQGIFLNFTNLYRFFREKLPFGIIQIGRGFRNEVSPRQGIIRLREFSMAEAEIFIHPNKKHPKFEEIREEKIRLNKKEMEVGEAVEEKIIGSEALAYYMNSTKKILISLGIDEKKMRFRRHSPAEMAHYAKECWDAELYSQRFGWIECVGIADRGSYDLEAHMEKSGEDLTIPSDETTMIIKAKMEELGPRFKEKAAKIKEKMELMDPSSIKGKIELFIDGKKIEIDKKFYEIKKEKKKIFPHVIEPSYGIDRILYFLLEQSYFEKNGYKILKLNPSIAPIKAGVFPLLAKDGLPSIAKKVDDLLHREGIITFYDESGSIGRRYARMDEVGTPFCITIDHRTLEDGTVTIRDRDTTEQIRIGIKECRRYLRKRF